MNRSTLFKAYNEIKPRTQASRKDAARLNRGLGVAQRKAPRPYFTTRHYCDCPDHTYRGLVCKHMRALQLKDRANDIEKQEAQILADLGF